MFEDILTKKEDRLYICELAEDCQEEFCLHKHEHYPNELGRPDQLDDDEPPCDCSKEECEYGGLCIPI